MEWGKRFGAEGGDRGQEGTGSRCDIGVWGQECYSELDIRFCGPSNVKRDSDERGTGDRIGVGDSAGGVVFRVKWESE